MLGVQTLVFTPLWILFQSGWALTGRDRPVPAGPGRGERGETKGLRAVGSQGTGREGSWPGPYLQAAPHGDRLGSTTLDPLGPLPGRKQHPWTKARTICIYPAQTPTGPKARPCPRPESTPPEAPSKISAKYTSRYQRAAASPVPPALTRVCVCVCIYSRCCGFGCKSPDQGD